jgi:hypothetical protein
VRRRLVVGNLKVGGAVSGRSIGKAFAAKRLVVVSFGTDGVGAEVNACSPPYRAPERGTHCRRYCFVHDKDKREFFVIMNQLMTTGHG